MRINFTTFALRTQMHEKLLDTYVIIWFVIYLWHCFHKHKKIKFASLLSQGKAKENVWFIIRKTRLSKPIKELVIQDLGYMQRWRIIFHLLPGLPNSNNDSLFFYSIEVYLVVTADVFIKGLLVMKERM